MKKILFLTRTLGRAGVGVSLVPVLKSLDYSQFEVTLGVQFPETELECEVPKEVNIVYYGEITSPLYKRIQQFNKKLKGRTGVLRFVWHVLNHLEEARMCYKVKKCFGKRYDTANAYHQGAASKYVINLVRAKKKILWYHASVIEFPWYKKIFSKADLIITDSENARQVMLNEWGSSLKSKIVSMNCLIPIEEILKKSEETIDVTTEKGQTVLLSCGRLTHEKGMDFVPKAASIIRKEYPDWDFSWIIVGDGPEREKIQKYISANHLKDCVKLVGYQKNPYPFFKMCDFYVQPSRLECFGITISEALIFKKILVTTKTVGGTEQIEDGVNGLVTSIDEQGIADALIRLYSDNSLREKIADNLKSIDFLMKREKVEEFINQIQL